MVSADDVVRNLALCRIIFGFLIGGEESKGLLQHVFEEMRCYTAGGAFRKMYQEQTRHVRQGLYEELVGFFLARALKDISDKFKFSPYKMICRDEKIHLATRSDILKIINADHLYFQAKYEKLRKKINTIKSKKRYWKAVRDLYPKKSAEMFAKIEERLAEIM